MTASASTLAVAQTVPLASLVVPTPGGISSRVLLKTSGGSVTLFAFDAGQGLGEHTAPVDALVLVLDGALTITVAGATVEAGPGTVVRLPGGVPHAVDAEVPTRMVLTMLRETARP